MEEKEKAAIEEKILKALENDFVNIEIQKINQKIVFKTQVIEHI
jgi:hypothetical protein